MKSRLFFSRTRNCLLWLC